MSGGTAESLTVTENDDEEVNGYGLVVVVSCGVPERTPPGDRTKPEGRDPEETAHVYVGPVPPVAANGKLSAVHIVAFTAAALVIVGPAGTALTIVTGRI